MRSNNISKTYHGAGYGRLSKEDAEVAGSESMQSNSIENQREYIEEFLKTKPEIITVDFYMDDGYSGVNFERPSFQKMMQDITERICPVSGVIIWRLGIIWSRYFPSWAYASSESMMDMTAKTFPDRQAVWTLPFGILSMKCTARICRER